MPTYAAKMLFAILTQNCTEQNSDWNNLKQKLR